MAATVARVSVSVWLPAPVHAHLASVAAADGVSLPVLARRAAAAGVEAPGGRVGVAAPAVEAVEDLRAAGYGLNRLLPAADAAAGVAAQAAIGDRMAAVLDRITAAADGVRCDPPARGVVGADREGLAARWRLVRVTVDPAVVEMWKLVAQVAGFRSVANWVRDALAGAYGLDVARPPAPAVIDARAVAGRVLGLVAQAETTLSGWPTAAGGGCEQRIAAAADALYAALHALVAYGGDPKARR